MSEQFHSLHQLRTGRGAISSANAAELVNRVTELAKAAQDGAQLIEHLLVAHAAADNARTVKRIRRAVAALSRPL